MKNQFEQHLTQNFSEVSASPFLVAVSGGVDSVVLTWLCYYLELNFALAHCNFQLRGNESDDDALFVKNLSEQIDVPYYEKSFATLQQADQRKQSTQIVARDLRYDWFTELIEETNYQYVVTGHQLDDNIETFFINFIRGTGLSGLTGIPEKNGYFLRPLLNFSRRQLENFAQQENLQWREDSTNATDAYQRNRIRHHLIPFLENETPQILQNFQKTQQHLNQSEQLLNDYKDVLADEITAKDPAGFLSLDTKKIKAQRHPEAVLYQLLKEFGFTQWEAIYNLLFSQSGREVFSQTHRLISDRNQLILKLLEDRVSSEYQIFENRSKVDFEGGRLHLNNVTKITYKANKIAYIAAEKLEFPLLLRKPKPGDRFQPFGMRGTKKISDFLIDKKLSLPEKERTWVLESNKKIVWVVGQRIDERFKVTEGDRNILKMKLEL